MSTDSPLKEGPIAVSDYHIKALKPHPIAEYWPAISADEYADLKQSIEQHGFNSQITLYTDADGRQGILDGIHRYKAMLELGILPIPRYFRVFVGDNPADFAFNQNNARRHMGETARATVIAQLEHDNWLSVGGHRSVAQDGETEPADESANGARRAPFKDAPTADPVSEESPKRGISTQEMAKKAGVGKRTAIVAKKAVKAGVAGQVVAENLSRAETEALASDPDAAEQVRSGQLSAKDGAKQARQRKSKAAPKGPTDLQRARAKIEQLEIDKARLLHEKNLIADERDDLAHKLAGAEEIMADNGAYRKLSDAVSIKRAIISAHDELQRQHGQLVKSYWALHRAMKKHCREEGKPWKDVWTWDKHENNPPDADNPIGTPTTEPDSETPPVDAYEGDAS